MKNENILAFARNLQTTNKEQGAGSLARSVFNGREHVVGFCCLGLQSADLGFVEVRHSDNGDARAVLPGTDTGPMGLAPQALAQWFGFDTGDDEPESEYNFTIDWDDDLVTPPNGDNDTFKYRDSDSEIDSLAVMNDLRRYELGKVGKQHVFTFAQIGDVVAHFGLAEMTA